MKRLALIILCVGISLTFALDTWAGGRYGGHSFSRGKSGFKGGFRGRGMSVNQNFGTSKGRNASRFQGRILQSNGFSTSRTVRHTIQSNVQATLHNQLSRAFPTQKRTIELNRSRSQSTLSTFRPGNIFRTTPRLGNGVLRSPFGFVSSVVPNQIVGQGRIKKKKSHRHLRRMKKGKRVFSDFGGKIAGNW